MKSGVPLQQMLTEVKRQSESKEDYLIAPNRLRMESYGKEMFLHLSDDSGTELIEPLTITGIAHRQIGTHLRIPAAYYDRMREERPDLLAYNANTWFKQESSQRMLRTLDGSARAYLSNRYRRIDNIDIASVTLPILGGLPDIRFESCQITESRMYIKAVNTRLQAEVSPGDIVQAGVIISNSEVGLGSVSIQPLIYRLVYDLWKTIVHSFLYTGKYLWIYGRKNMKLFGGNFRELFDYLEEKSTNSNMSGIDFRCLFLNPNSAEVKHAHSQQDIFLEELKVTIRRAENQIGDNQVIKNCFRMYENRREEVIIRLDNCIIYSKPHFDKNGYPQFMTDSKFEVFSASSDRGKECIQKFCAIWDASTNLF